MFTADQAARPETQTSPSERRIRAFPKPVTDATGLHRIRMRRITLQLPDDMMDVPDDQWVARSSGLQWKLANLLGGMVSIADRHNGTISIVHTEPHTPVLVMRLEQVREQLGCTLVDRMEM